MSKSRTNKGSKVEPKALTTEQWEEIQTTVSNFRKFADRDIIQDWARVAFLVQYICQVIFYEKGIPVTEVEGLNSYLKNNLGQVTMYKEFTKFFNEFPNARPLKHHK